MRHPAFTFAPNFINNQNKSSMAIKKVSNEFMAKVLNDVAWKALSIINRYYDDASLYTIDFLEKYVDRIPTNNLQNSYLWYSIVKRRMKELAFEIVSQ